MTLMPLLFSYGTLLQENVQRSIFGRALQGYTDQLVGFALSLVQIDNPDVVATSGKTHHPIVTFTGNETDRVDGTVFEITDNELQIADKYEVADYRRIGAQLSSGKRAWVYVDARRASGMS
jgi:hypothetical protein